MRTIGIDLAITGQHQAVIVDEMGRAIGHSFRFDTTPTDLDELLDRARTGADENELLRVVMEPTGLSWLPVASYFVQRRVTVYLVNTQQVADLRKFYSKHAKSDRISARVLARLPWVNPESLHPLRLTGADCLSGQRWCRQQEELTQLMTAIKNRVQAWERAFWPGLEQLVGDLFAAWVRRWRQVWYDPWQLQNIQTRQLADFLAEAGADPDQVETLAVGLQTVARRTVALFGTPKGGASPYVDYARLQDQVLRELRLLAVGGAFDAGIEAVRACLRGEEAELLGDGRLRPVEWRELPSPDPADRDLPLVVSRIERVRESHDSLPRFWGELVQPRQEGAADAVPDPLAASGAVPAGGSALQLESTASVVPALDPELCNGCGRCWTASARSPAPPPSPWPSRRCCSATSAGTPRSTWPARSAPRAAPCRARSSWAWRSARASTW